MQRTSGRADVDQALLAIAGEMRSRPPTRDGEPVRTEAVIPLTVRP